MGYLQLLVLARPFSKLAENIIYHKWVKYSYNLVIQGTKRSKSNKINYSCNNRLFRLICFPEQFFSRKLRQYDRKMKLINLFRKFLMKLFQIWIPLLDNSSILCLSRNQDDVIIDLITRNIIVVYTAEIFLLEIKSWWDSKIKNHPKL